MALGLWFRGFKFRVEILNTRPKPRGSNLGFEGLGVEFRV